MIECPSCAAKLTEPSRFCPACGKAIEGSLLPTMDSPGAIRAGSTPRTRQLLSADTAPGARFTTGMVLADRYRIVGLLGKGGMGEVFRAEDLKLSQDVALKFLPEKTAQDEKALVRFYKEVRIARQITHPNVCRVFDISEIDGQHFISMEYVDGEDLASLLRRIGRLPSDKATELAQQICAGLHAAHQIGVLHRDLKPANIMLDGRGNVRITDFGLAGVAEEFSNQDVIAGTPAYMAPEQLEGREVTVRSDLYSLGLVLYEIFTGKRVYEASSIQELQRKQQELTPSIPEHLSREIDPVVERVLLRCLDNDPRHRPSTALQVSAGLPGGDPLAAALAAGETPSPELVAAAGKEGALKPVFALLALSAILLELIIILTVSNLVMLESWVAIEKSTEVLRDRARNIVSSSGHSIAISADDAAGYGYKGDYFDYIRNRPERDRFEKMRGTQPLTMYYWYRQTPALFLPVGKTNVTWFNPPRTIPGETAVILDTRARLVEFQAVPAQSASSSGNSVDWKLFFDQAELPLSEFEISSPQWIPPVFADQRIAWTGVYPEHPDIPIRVEAASLHGMPVYFQIIAPWDKPPDPANEALPSGLKAGLILMIVAIIAILLVAVLLARSNVRKGRGDRRGAFRTTVFLFVVAFAGNMLIADHVPGLAQEIGIVVQCLEQSLLFSLPFWLIYIALEPFVRRIWPKALISWNRLLAGNYRDPMIGRDLLAGMSLGMVHTILIFLVELIPFWMGDILKPAGLAVPDYFMGLKYAVANLLFRIIANSVFVGLLYLFLIFLFYAIVRRERIAFGLAWLFFSSVMILIFAVGEGSPLVWIVAPLSALAIVITISRFGLLAIMVFHLSFLISFSTPMTPDLSKPYASITAFHLALLLALAIYGFKTSLAGQKLFRSLLPGE